MTTTGTANGIDSLADQLKSAAAQYQSEARELEKQAAALLEINAAMAALTGQRERVGGFPSRKWTPAEDAQVLAFDGTKDSIRSLADRLGRTRAAVSVRRHELRKAPPVVVPPGFALPGYAPV